MSEDLKKQWIRHGLLRSAEALQRTSASSVLVDQVQQASEMIFNTYQCSGCLFIAGNGGSAADAQHWVAELVVRFHRNRTPIRAFSLTVDTSVLTAIGNDLGYDWVFARQVEACMSSKDLFLAISTSGQSENILEALKMCQSRGIKSILLTGATGGRALAYATHCIQVPSHETSLIQESHLAIYHLLCQRLEEDLMRSGNCQLTSLGDSSEKV